MVNLTNQQLLDSLVSVNVEKKWPMPERKNIVMVFTPRSGSTWFGSLLKSTGVFGYPDEYLNQDFMPSVVREVGARTEVDYLNAVATVSASENRIFLIQVVWGHILKCEIDFFEHFNHAYVIYLRRGDILAQAISLYIAQQSGVFHYTQESLKDNSLAKMEMPTEEEETFQKIKEWWGHILNYEMLAETFFCVRGTKMLRLYYEDICNDPVAAVADMAGFCGLDYRDVRVSPSSFVRTPGTLGRQLARNFALKNEKFVTSMNALRPALGASGSVLR